MQSAIIVTVPEAEALVGRWRDQGDPVARLGVPAHVTLLYPFVEDPDEGVVEELRFFFAGVDAFPLTFRAVGAFDDDVTYLAPDEGEECRQLTLALARRWPDHPPYGGKHPDPIAHLTVVSDGDAALQAAAREAITPGLPVHGHADHAALYVQRPDGTWHEYTRFPLAEAELT